MCGAVRLCVAVPSCPTCNSGRSPRWPLPSGPSCLPVFCGSKWPPAAPAGTCWPLAVVGWHDPFWWMWKPCGRCRARLRHDAALAAPLIEVRRSAETGARIKPAGVVPQQLALAWLAHGPAADDRRRLRKMAFAMRVVRGVHQDVLAEEIGDGVGQRRPFRDLDTLKIPAAGDVLAWALLQHGQSRLDRLGMLVEPRDPERQPAVTGFERGDPQGRIAVHHAAADQRGHVAHAAPGMRGGALQP